MESYSRPGPEPHGAEVVEPLAPITRDILESYLVCKTKAFLKMRRLHGTKSDFVLLGDLTREGLRRQMATALASKFEDSEILRSVRTTEGVLRQGVALILDATVEMGDFALQNDALKRVNGTSRLGDHHYVPVLVYEGFKVRPIHRRVLEVFALVLQELQGRVPDYGLMLKEGDVAPHRVRFQAGFKEARRILQEIKLFRGAGQPPTLTLNDHCQMCEYRQQCRTKAIAEDNISLLRGMREKHVRRFRKRGITTIAQLSRTFRAQKKNKRKLKNKRSHSFALQAQALADGKIYVNGTPSFPPMDEAIFFDLEGDPEKDLVYLIGVIVVANGVDRRFSFWADEKAQETTILESFLAVVRDYPNLPLLHYGSYETAFLKRIKPKVECGEEIDRLIERSVNVLGSIYGTLYFPCYSNGLKDIASSIGFSWTDPDASGIQSLAWRRRWERGEGDDFKRKILEYNLEDCAALKRLTGVITNIVAALGAEAIQEPPDQCQVGLPWAKAADNHAGYQKWHTVRFACPDFDFINKCSYFDYQRQRVHIRTGAAAQSVPRRKKPSPGKPRVTRTIELRARKCPRCDGSSILRSGPKGWKKLVYDLKITSGGLRRSVIECRASHHQCQECSKRFLPRKFRKLDRFSHGLKSWAMYMHIVHQTSFPKITTMFQDFFGLKVDSPRVYRFKVMFAHFYAPAVRKILNNLISGDVIYADETEVKLKKTKGYVWVLSNREEVLYLYRPSREVDFLKEMLAGFSGVLVTDFYTAYDGIGCLQQKCLVHLMRDLNAGLMENPFDEEYKHLAFEFGKLLKAIVTTIDRHGLKQKRLSTHRKDVERFYKEVVEPAGESEVAEDVRGRFLKHRAKLFEFLNHDGVAWNNNYAEHAIKVFAQYRVISDGIMNEAGIDAYLVILSIYQTCCNKGIGLLKFFLSGERDIDSYQEPGRKSAKPFTLDEYPSRFYLPWERE